MFLLRVAVFAVFFASGLLTSCETVTTQSQKVLASLGLSKNEPPKKKSVRSPRQTPSKSTKAPETAADPTPQPKPTNNDSAIIITQTDTNKTRQVPKKELKNVVKPTFRVEAPVDVQKRVGGVTRSILSDNKFLYLDFPQHFAIYDHSLNFLARRKVAFPVKQAQHFTRDGKIYIYIKEENNVLEIMELDVVEADKKINVSLKDAVSFDVGGDFFWLSANEFVVLLADRIQILDFANFNDIRITQEIALGQVQDVLSQDGILFLSRQGSLEAFDRTQNKHVLSLKVGRDFRFGGLKDTPNSKQLVLTFVNSKGHFKGFTTLSMPKNLTQISGFDEIITLPQPLKNPHMDLSQNLLIGRETNNKSAPLALYSTTHNRILRGELSQKQDLVTWALLDGKLYLVTPQAISINSINLKNDVIANARELEKHIQKTSSGPKPLAQLGMSKLVEDEYTVTPQKTIAFMADARQVFLLDENHLAIFENRIGENVHQVLSTDHFMDEDFILKETTQSEALFYDKVKTTDIGLLAYSQKQAKIYFTDVNFTSLTALPITVQDLISWSVFSTIEGEILVLSSKNPLNPAPASTPPAKTKITKPVKAITPVPQPATNYTIEFYLLKSPTEVSLIRQISRAEKPFVFITDDQNLMVLTDGELEIFSLDFAKNFATTSLDKIKFYEQHPVLDAKLSPRGDRIYALVKQEDRLKILVQSTTNPTHRTMLKDFEILPEHFAGSTFSKGGQLYILPTLEGTLFYDMSELGDKDEDARIVANWPEPSWGVDVAKGGRYMCVALGPKGVYCGELLFY